MNRRNPTFTPPLGFEREHGRVIVGISVYNKDPEVARLLAASQEAADAVMFAKEDGYRDEIEDASAAFARADRALHAALAKAMERKLNPAVRGRRIPNSAKVFVYPQSVAPAAHTYVPPVSAYALVPEQSRRYPRAPTLRALQVFAANKGHHVIYTAVSDRHKIGPRAVFYVQTQGVPTTVVATYSLAKDSPGHDARDPSNVHLVGDKTFEDIHPKANPKKKNPYFSQEVAKDSAAMCRRLDLDGHPSSRYLLQQGAKLTDTVAQEWWLAVARAYLSHTLRASKAELKAQLAPALTRQRKYDHRNAP